MKKRGMTAILLAGVLFVTGILQGRGDVNAEESATSTRVNLVRTEGTVKVKDSAGKELTQSKNMGIYAGNTVSTNSKSYAWMSLGDKTAAKLDESSSADISASGKELKVSLGKGNLWFNTTGKLDTPVSITTSSAVMGIRGTIGIVNRISDSETIITILEGTVEITYYDAAGNPKTITVRQGQTVEIDRTKGTAQIHPAYMKDVPRFVLKDIAEDNKKDSEKTRFDDNGGGAVISRRIFDASDIDLRGLNDSLATGQLMEDQAKKRFEGTGDFDPVYYAKNNTDVSDKNGSDPGRLWEHYVIFGQYEGRPVNQVHAERLKKQGGSDLSAWEAFDRMIRTSGKGEPEDNGGSNNNSNGEKSSTDSHVKKYTVKVKVAGNEGGSAYADKTKAKKGVKVTLTAIPESDDYVFDRWVVKKGNITLSDEESSTATFKMPAGKVKVTARFTKVTKPEEHAVNVISGEGGTASASEATALNGKVVTLSATPDEGYVFAGWTVISGDVQPESLTDSTSTFVMKNADVTIRADFRAVGTGEQTDNGTHNVSVTADPGGTASAYPTSATKGMTVNLSATAAEGYEFAGWIVTGGDAHIADPMESNTSLTMLDTDVSVRASFSRKTETPEKTYNVTVTATEGGSAQADPTSAVKGTRVTLTATASDGYEFSGWTVAEGGLMLGDDDSATETFTMPESNVVVRANFTKKADNTTVNDKKYAVNVTAGQGGTAAADPASAAKGAVVTLTATASAGYTFTGWTVTGGNVTLSSTTASPATFTMPEEDVAVTANFTAVKSKHTVTVDVPQTAGAAASPGTASADKSEAAEGETITLTATPTAGFVFTGWTVTGGNVTLNSTTASPATFTMPDGDVSITANFEKPKHKVTVTSSNVSWGTATVDKTDAAEGETVTITAISESGYKLNSSTVVEGGVNLTQTPGSWGVMIGNGKKNYTMTFTMGTEDVTIALTFGGDY